MLTHLIRSARKSVQLTMAYFAPSDELIDEICGAAKRGVKVQLMLPERCDVQLLLIAARSFYETLLSAGVEVYERKAVVLHAKTLVVDKAISVVGSTNLDYRSIEYNCELSAVIRSMEFGHQMDDLFKNDVRFTTKIELREWRKRPFLDRVGQWAVNRARYLL
jgi:cardiolipin synthase